MRGYLSQEAKQRMPSSYFFLCAGTSNIHWYVLISQALIAPSCPPDIRVVLAVAYELKNIRLEIESVCPTMALIYLLPFKSKNLN